MKTKLIVSKEICYKKIPAIIKFYSNYKNIFFVEIININGLELKFCFKTLLKVLDFIRSIEEENDENTLYPQTT